MALRLCTGRMAHRGNRGIAILFHDQRHQKGMRHAPAALYSRERPGTHCTGGWVGPRAGLDRCGSSRHHRDSIPRTVQLVASRYIPTELSRPTHKGKVHPITCYDINIPISIMCYYNFLCLTLPASWRLLHTWCPPCSTCQQTVT